MKSNLTIDDKRLDGRKFNFRYFEKRKMDVDMRGGERNQPSTFFISSSNLIQSSISHFNSSNINFSTINNQNPRYLR